MVDLVQSDARPKTGACVRADFTVDLRRLFDEPFRKRVGQGHHRKLLLVAENRMDRPNGLPYAGRRQGRRVDYIERVYNTIRRHSTNGCSARLSSKRRFD
jgi:hypothetical protein